MGNDVVEDIGVAFDREVKTPVVIDARLPATAGLVVLLGAQRRVAEIAEEVSELLAETFLDFRRRRDVPRDERLSQNGAHGVPVA